MPRDPLLYAATPTSVLPSLLLRKPAPALLAAILSRTSDVTREPLPLRRAKSARKEGASA